VKFGKNRKAFTIAVVALGCLSFFLPVISIQAPIVGKMEFSPFNIVSRIATGSSQESPSFTDVTAMTKDISKSKASSPSSIQNSNPVPLGIRVIPFMPVEVAIAYLSLILIAFALTVNPLQQNIRTAAIAGLAASVIALGSIFCSATQSNRVWRQASTPPKCATIHSQLWVRHSYRVSTLTPGQEFTCS